MTVLMNHNNINIVDNNTVINVILNVLQDLCDEFHKEYSFGEYTFY